MRGGSLLVFCAALGALSGCARAPELRGKLAGLRQLSDEAERNDALRCAPRELALARAHIEFAELELSKGQLSRATEHVKQAELNTEAAHLQSPPEHCTGARRAAPGDADGDGIGDPEDRCVDEPENYNGFEDEDGCPDDPDTDGDGVKDSVDQCVLEPEDIDGYLDEDGCPDPDDDLDGIPDAEDQCPREPEDPDGYEDQDGCPDPDNDADGVPDVSDQCPNTPGQKDKEPLGCPAQPALVVVTDCEVKITQQIHFASGKAVIQKESFGVLDAIVTVLDKSPAIKLEIQGHTDDKGSDALNAKLSEDRAQAVLKYLVSHGISPSRLRSHGYGESQPLVPNNSDANRSLNRRVQFIRTEGAKEGCGADGQTVGVPANSSR